MCRCCIAFLKSGSNRVDLTEGNRNGKKRAIDEFLFAAPVDAYISAKEDYLLYREALAQHIMTRIEMQDIELKQILHAREMGLSLLKRNTTQ